MNIKAQVEKEIQKAVADEVGRIFQQSSYYNQLLKALNDTLRKRGVWVIVEMGMYHVSVDGDYESCDSLQEMVTRALVAYAERVELDE